MTQIFQTNITVMQDADGTRETFTVPTENGKKVMTMTEYIENPLSGKLRGVTYEDGKIIDVHIRDTDDVVKVFVPVRHGRWLDRPKNQGLKDGEIGTVGMVDGEPWSSCYCSECGEWLVASDEYPVKGNYCPNCGAKMDGGAD